MSEFKGTPGPWFAHGRYIGTKNHKSAVGECRDINGNWSNDYKSSADAQLIAAAPDLLEELIRAANDLDSLGYNVSSARSAIAKALGETK